MHGEIFTRSLTKCFSLEFEWQQFFSGLKNYSKLIRANFSSAVVMMVPTLPLISSSSLFQRFSGTVPRAPTTIGITITLMFSNFSILWQSPGTCPAFRPPWLSLSGLLTQKNTRLQVLVWYVITYIRTRKIVITYIRTKKCVITYIRARKYVITNVRTRKYDITYISTRKYVITYISLVLV